MLEEIEKKIVDLINNGTTTFEVKNLYPNEKEDVALLLFQKDLEVLEELISNGDIVLVFDHSVKTPNGTLRDMMTIKVI